MADNPTTGAGAAPPQPATATDATDVKALSDRLALVEAERDAAKQLAESNAAAIRTLTEQNAAMVKDARRKRFTDEVMGKSAENGAMWAGEVAANVSVLETLADAVGEDSDQFKAFVTQQRATAAQLKTSGLFTEIGTSQSGAAGAGAQARLNAMASARASERGLSFADALAQIAKEQPDLYREAAVASQVKV